jgi:SAM-dependent methyltransferase
MNKTTYDAITEFYNLYPEENRLSSRCGEMEFLTTIKYIEKYLTSGMKILEIGAGTGRYSLYFARQGYEVDAVELLPRNIEIFKENISPSDKVEVYEGNAIDLSFLDSNKYDITLVLGPMYHLFDYNDKNSAFAEAIRVTKGNGLVFAAYCMNDAVIIRQGFIKGDVSLEVEPNEGFGKYKSRTKKSDVFEIYTKEEIDELTAHFPVKRLHYVGTDMLGVYMRSIIEDMSQDKYKLFLDYHMSICERSDMVGITGHSLDILRKER